ncbi:MAG: thioredoxin family protein [Chitinophagaceae bacterium]|nr:MAG: thioredoxin family protein [Chitinophagaceae bacterium]
MAVFSFSGSFIGEGLTYHQYRMGLHALLKHPPSAESALKMMPYIQRNQELMDEYDQSYRISDELRGVMAAVPFLNWVVITEGWCGDAAFNIPMFALLEQLFPEKIKLRLYLRDKNPGLMDAYLTEGGRSIPKLVLLDSSLQEVGTWGPRPAALMQLLPQWKESGDPLKELIRKTHEWYNNDRTISLQSELVSLLSSTSVRTK